MPLYCASCGYENADGSRFCGGCGVALGSGSRAAPEVGHGFRTAFLWTVGIIAGLGVISTAGAAYEGLYFVWFAAVAALVVAGLAVIGFASAKRGQMVSGVLAGVGVGAQALALTCFANLSTIDLGF